MKRMTGKTTIRVSREFAEFVHDKSRHGETREETLTRLILSDYYE